MTTGKPGQRGGRRSGSGPEGLDGHDALPAKPRARVARRSRRAPPETVLIDGENALEVLGRRVNQLRVAQDVSQEELADLAGLDRTYVSGIERGVRNPTLLVLLRLARSLDVRLDDLVQGS